MAELDRLYERLDRGFSEVNARLDALNGRTRESEQAIAVLNERSGAGKAAALGGGVAGLFYAVLEGVRWVMGR